MTPETPDLIRITREEATSQHVDDLLRRQMSLRGEAGVTRDRGRRWFLQNWLIFGLVGGLAAALSWAVIEPFFDDLLYIQGPVESVKAGSGTLEKLIVAGDENLTLRRGVVGEISIHGRRIRLVSGLAEILPDGSRRLADLGAIGLGETVGVYGESHRVGGEDVALGLFLVSHPSAALARKSEDDWHRAEMRHSVMGLTIFSIVAGMIGLFLGAADGLVCRLPRRALLGGGVGLLVGLIGGLVCSIAASVIYGPITHFAMKQGGGNGLSALGFALQVGGRSLAWALAGMAMGLGQGIALRSKRLAIYGFLGGVIGGLLGGLLFDPIDLILLGSDKPSAEWSRLVGFTVIGVSVGGLIGVVELLARDAWLRMTQGPLTGKEFLLFKDVMKIGSSPRSDLYLFNDPLVAEQHAILRTVGDDAEIESLIEARLVQVNGRSVRTARLRHGDTVAIGRTAFLFQRRQG